MKRLTLLFLCLIFSLFVIPSSTSAFTLTKGGNQLGLVGWWTFDGKDMASNVRDVTGNGNNGFLSSGFTSTTTVAGKLGQALSFNNGTTQGVSLGNVAGASGGAEVAVSFWMKDNNLGVSQYFISKFNWSNYGPWVFAHGTGNGINFYVYNDSVQSSISGGYTIADSNWHHYVGTFSGGKANLYVDGISMGEGSAITGNIKTDSGFVCLGTMYYNIGSCADVGVTLKGVLDDVRIYSRSLSASEILALYNTGAGSKQNVTPTKAVASGLVGWWTMDGKDMTSNVRDISGQGNNGFLFGQAATTTIIGKVGQALSLDGVDDYIRTSATSFNFERTDRFSFSMWVKRDSNNSTDPFLGRYDTGADYRGYSFGVDSLNTTTFGVNSIYLDLMSSYSGSNRLLCGTGAGQIVPGTWQHVVITYDGASTNTSFAVYVDNQSKSVTCKPTVLSSTIQNSLNLRLGNDSDVDYFSGKMDDVRIYNRTLSAAEVGQLYNQGAGTKQNVAPPVTAASGLVGYWTFDGKNMTQNVKDSSGLGNNGNLFGQGATTTVIGKIGQALQFDGVDDYVDAGDPSVITGALAVSTSAWFKFNSFTGGRILVSKWNEGTGGPFMLWWSEISEAYVYSIISSNGFTQAVTPHIPADNLWHHLVGTYDGSFIRVYLDGVLVGGPTAQTGTLVAGNSIRVGVTSSATGWFSGSLDDVRIYSRALSATEIRQLYNLGK